MLNSLKCLIQCLERTISSDKNVLAEAQLVLEKCAQENTGQFMSSMSIVIADPNNSPIARQAAGIQLKNCLTVRDVALKKECQLRWSKIEKETRIAVRERLISTLGTENIHPSCAAQCLAYIGAAELFLGMQSSSELTFLEDLLSALCDVVIQPANEHRKEAALETIAYICQEINVQVLVNFHPSIRHSILFCMEDSESTGRIRLAAARALLSSLECIYPTFDTEEGRDAIMQVVCDGTQSSVVEESVIWLQILVKIGSFYYHHLEKYMVSAIVPITLKAMASTDSDIALQGMEFWCSVAEVEFNLASGAYDPALVVPSSFYAEKALPKLVPVLMSALVGWQDDPDDIDDFEDWTPFKGACSCLILLAQCCSNTVATYVSPQIGIYITRSNWRYRNAALWTIGSILEELNPKSVYSEISPFMVYVWESTHDHKSAKVRYAAHVLMGRIFEFCPDLIPSALRTLIKGLLAHLDDGDHRVAAAACKILPSLVRFINKITSEKNEDDVPLVTTSFPRQYKKIVQKLLQCCGIFREHQKRAAQEALVDVLLSSPDDCYVTVKSTIQALMWGFYPGVGDGYYFPCAMLSRAMTKLKAEDEMHNALMRRLISLLQSEGPRGVVIDKEDAFLATSTTISLLPLDELKVYLPELTAFFKLAVESRDPCPTVVSLIGDLFRALGTESLPYLDGFCLNFFDLLARNKIPTKLRSSCVATLIDMANSVGVQNFWPYIACTLNQLEYASSITVKKDPEHEELQENMLQLYTGLFIFIYDQVSKQSSENRNQKLISQISLMENCLAGFSKLMVAIVDEDTSDMIIIACAELVGIIFDKLGIDTAMKYLESNLNLKWLVSSAVHRADNSRESNSAFSEPRFAMSALEAFNAVE